MVWLSRRTRAPLAGITWRRLRSTRAQKVLFVQKCPLSSSPHSKCKLSKSCLQKVPCLCHPCLQSKSGLQKILLCLHLSLSSPHQTTRWASEANLGFRRIAKTSRRQAGTTSRRWRSMNPKSTTRKVSVGNMGSACKTRAPWGGNTTRKWTSMNHKKVPSFYSLLSLSCPVFPSSDYKSGFGGKFGVAEQKDKSVLGWEHHEKVEKHESQKGELCI